MDPHATVHAPSRWHRLLLAGFLHHVILDAANVGKPHDRTLMPLSQPPAPEGRSLLLALIQASCSAPTLKSLRLISSNHISNEGLMKAINKFPMLEELELSLCKNVFGKVYEVIGIACPHLKSFRLSYPCFYSIEDAEYNKDEEAMGIGTMFALRSLQLFGSELTNKGLTAILDNCTHLEYLDIRHCFNIYMDTTLRAKCAGIKTMKLPHGSTDDYEFQTGHPVRTRARKTRRNFAFYGNSILRGFHP